MNLRRLFATLCSVIVTLSISLALTLTASNSFAEGEESKSTWGDDDGGDGFINLRGSGLGLLIGYINLDLDFKISDQWSIGPTLTYWKFNSDSVITSSGKLEAVYSAFGVRANWARNGTFRSGLYVSPMLQLVRATVTGVSATSGRTLTGEASAPVLTGLVGYQWFFGSGFNMNVGGGLAIGTANTKAEATDGTTTSKVETSRTGGLAIDFMIGYVF